MVKEEVKNILIIKWGALGDLIASTSAIKTVRENFPNAHITLLTNKLMTQIIPQNFLVDEHIIVNTDRNKVVDSIFKQLLIILKLRRRKFDLGINLRWTSERAALITYLSAAKVRVSSGPKKLMNLYTIKLEHPKGRYHEIHRNLDIVKAVGCSVSDENPVVFISQEEQKYADMFFEKNKLKKANTICIHPGASKSIRAWMPERFAEIGIRLVKKFDVNILLTWGKGEEKLVSYVAEQIGNKAIISASTETIGQLAAMIKNCSMFFSNCTGPMNVSVAVKTPTIALLGSSHPVDWGAFGNKHINIKSPLNLEHYSEEDEKKAMEALSIDYVWEIVKKRYTEIQGQK
ncbi:MAG: glycosyltransferase family 9 protein [Melioribacter sp.]|uniref:glycosyltransferase family 9 protein n=1 Tax=Rosettibacter primus TaxID=3111523 RepID=UPI00247DEE86|nr:glycosyltransferase family 9 protein [Melioribacter sp.]